MINTEQDNSLDINDFGVQNQQSQQQDPEKLKQAIQTKSDFIDFENLVRSSRRDLETLLEEAYAKLKYARMEQTDERKPKIFKAANSRIDVFTAQPYFGASILDPQKFVNCFLYVVSCSILTLEFFVSETLCSLVLRDLMLESSGILHLVGAIKKMTTGSLAAG